MSSSKFSIGTKLTLSRQKSNFFRIESPIRCAHNPIRETQSPRILYKFTRTYNDEFRMDKLPNSRARVTCITMYEPYQLLWVNDQSLFS